MPHLINPIDKHTHQEKTSALITTKKASVLIKATVLQLRKDLFAYLDTARNNEAESFIDFKRRAVMLTKGNDEPFGSTTAMSRLTLPRRGRRANFGTFAAKSFNVPRSMLPR